MDEALNAHPDVAQNLLKLFSDALTESRGKVKELELSLSEKVCLSRAPVKY
jgi:CRP-like cAMP-binding protein